MLDIIITAAWVTASAVCLVRGLLYFAGKGLSKQALQKKETVGPARFAKYRLFNGLSFISLGFVWGAIPFSRMAIPLYVGIVWLAAFIGLTLLFSVLAGRAIGSQSI